MPAQFKARPCRNGARPSHIVALTTNSDTHDWNGVFISRKTSDYNGQTVYSLLLLASQVPSQEWLEIDGGVISALFNKANRR